jgi:hypothetical protein
MRITVTALVLAAAFSASSAAMAQTGSSTYPYCLMTGPAQDCSYVSMGQCLASKRGNADFCEPNNWYSGYSGPYSRQLQ